ncbi:MAG: dihydroorotase [Actinomycetes bacterium]
MNARFGWKGGVPANVLITGGRVVDSRQNLDVQLDVLVTDGVITEVGPVGTITAGDSTTTVNADNGILMPAFTDPHIHLRTPGQEHKETIATGTKAAAAGGYCLVIAMPNTSPVIDGPDLLRGILARASETAVIPMAQTGAITRDLAGTELTEMATMMETGAAGFTDDGIAVRDAGVFRRALRYQAVAGGVIALHEEDPALSMGAPLNEGVISARLGLRGQPGSAESTMIARDCALARMEDAAIHIQHVSTYESVEVIRREKAQGTKVTAEASPHHLLLTEEACSTLDSRAKMNPPLRTEVDRNAVIAGLVDGTLDCVATDHAPHSDDEKSQPFEDAPFGTTGLETSFAVLYDELVTPGLISLPVLVERMTSGCIPFGFDPPTVAVGQPANLALFDTRAEWVAGEGGWVSMSSNSCFAGRTMSGRISLTLAGGVIVHTAGATQ